jgi:hypothetical protein
MIALYPDADFQWLDAVLASMASLDRLLALHTGALSVAQSKGWSVYTQYTANLRPYAANPPDIQLEKFRFLSFGPQAA